MTGKEEYKKETTRKYKREEIVRLILAYFRGNADDGQAKELNEWVNENEKNRALFDRLQRSDYVQRELSEYRKYDSVEDWKKISSRLMQPRKKVYRSMWAYAASVIILVGVGLSVWHLTNKEEKTVQYAQTIEHGRSKAILFLESGKAIELEVEQDTLCEKVEGENFVNDGKKLVYMETPGEKKVEWHTLQVPRGGEYVLNLSDGTVVTLNADSKIHYPVQFSGGERQVLLEGEALFDVAKDSLRPFVVKTNGIDVRVLGTLFNVKAYPDENQQATLVSGVVEVLFDKQKILLSPGEQLTRHEHELSVERVDINSYIAWKSDRFVFENEPLEGVLKKLERWYDIDVFIQNPALKEMRFTGKLPKYENINQVLDILALTTRVKFELNKRTLIVQLE